MNLRSLDDIRSDFPGLEGVPLDGAAGTLVPQPVIDAIAGALRDSMANLGGRFPGSARSGAAVEAAREAIADLTGGVPEGVVLGPNMTTLTFLFAQALSADWGEGDEVVITTLDHDANLRPWVLAAERAGATVRWAEFDPASGELAPEAFDAVLSERTRLVAVTAASNAIGTRPDVRAISERAHAVGAHLYVDGVHATPHVPTDVEALGADFYALSTYKLCGPHQGAVVADPALLERLRPPKLVPAPDAVPWRFERGTQPFELFAGIAAAVDWLAGLTDTTGARRDRVLAAFRALEERLTALGAQAVEGISALPGVQILGRAARRTPTISFTVDGRTPQEVAAALADEGIAVWAGDNYARELMRRFERHESGGAVRASIVLYNSSADVDRLVEAVTRLSRGQ